MNVIDICIKNEIASSTDTGALLYTYKDTLDIVIKLDKHCICNRWNIIYI